MLIAMKRYHIILKIKINACLQNMSIIIQLKMIYIIIKFNVHNLTDITQHNKHHINVLNNVHLICSLHMTFLKHNVFHNVKIILYKIKLNIV